VRTFKSARAARWQTVAALLFHRMITAKRLTVWGTGLLALTWFIYIHTMATPGLIDRAGRFKGTDYIQFYVMGSLLAGGRTDALYDGTAHLDEGRRRIDPGLILHAEYPNYGPQIALFFTPLALLPFGWSLALFLTAMALCYSAGVWLIWRECDGLRAYGPVVGVLALASPLFYTMVLYGQLSAAALLFWSSAYAAMRRNRRFIAGLALGCLVYKPTFVVLPLVVMLLRKEGRVMAGMATSAAGQFAVALAVAGAGSIAQYSRVLWTLMLDPRLVELHPIELHSLRGFVELLVASPAAVSVCFGAALFCVTAAAVRVWSGQVSDEIRWSALALLTVLASPHLIAYDLVLLTFPMLLLANWAVRHPDHPIRGGIALLLVLVYFAPFSSIVARFTGVQVSVVVMTVLAWRTYQISRQSESLLSTVPA